MNNVKQLHFLWLLLIVTACTTQVARPAPPEAIQGVMDARTWDFAADGSLDLKGEWGFDWEMLFPPGETRPPTAMIVAPGNWLNSEMDGQPVPGIGYATYRLQLQLPEAERLYGFKLTEMGTAYRLWADDQLVAGNGMVGSNAAESQPESRSIVTYFTPSQSTVALTLQVSNFHHQRGGMWYNIRFGLAHDIQRERTLAIASDLFLFGSLTIMGLYHLVLYAFRRKEKAPLYFGLFCLIIGIRNIVTNDGFLTLYQPLTPWFFTIRLEYLTFYIAVPTFITFVSTLYPQESSRYINRFGQVVGLLFTLIVLLTPATVFTGTLAFYQWFTVAFGLYGVGIFVLAVIRKRDSAWLLMGGFLIMFATIINDILYASGGLQSEYLISVGLFIFILSQSAVLARQFSKAFTHAEELSAEQIALHAELAQAHDDLLGYNSGLEQRVHERTRELSQTLTELKATQSKVIMTEKMAALGQLMAGVAHEINNPLGAIRASIENVEAAFQQTLHHLPVMLMRLSPEERDLFIALLQQPRPELSFKEKRSRKRAFKKLLEPYTITPTDMVANTLITVGVEAESLETWKPLLQSPHVDEIFQQADELISLQTSSDNIKLAVNRATDIVTALKKYAHHDQQRAMELGNVIDGLEVVLMLYHNMLKHGIEVIRQYDEDVPDIICHADALNQVWTNLIHNAVQAMNGQGQLIIMVQHRAEGVWVSITDNGPGIPPEIQARIFEPFFTTKPAGEGSGIGLDIVKQIIEHHEGTIVLETVPGKTTFTIQLPLEPNPNSNDGSGADVVTRSPMGSAIARNNV